MGYKAKTHTASQHEGVGYAPLCPYLDQNKCTPPRFNLAVALRSFGAARHPAARGHPTAQRDSANWKFKMRVEGEPKVAFVIRIKG